MEERYAFLTEWYDETASLIRQYQLLFYFKDNSIEMYDVKNKKMFLRRTRIDGIKLSDLYIGASLCILSRQLNFIDFGDEYTRKKLSSQNEKTVVIALSWTASKIGSIIDCIHKHGFLITNLKTFSMSRTVGQQFCKLRDKQDDFLQALTSGSPIAMELMGSSALSKIPELLASMGLVESNRVYCSQSIKDVVDDSRFIFGPESSLKSSARLLQTTLCLIKPHIIQNGQLGKVLEHISEHGGFDVTAMKTVVLSRANAEEFLEVYKGVVAEYPSMVNQLISGTCLAIELVKLNEPDFTAADVQSAFREYVGPSDPEIGRHLRPHTLRAHFGKNKIENAVHCTDLVEDAELEVEYFFRILAN